MDIKEISLGLQTQNLIAHYYEYILVSKDQTSSLLSSTPGYAWWVIESSFSGLSQIPVITALEWALPLTIREEAERGFEHWGLCRASG